MRFLMQVSKVNFAALSIAALLLLWFTFPALRSLFIDLSGHARLLIFSSEFTVALVNSALVALLSTFLVVLIAVVVGWQIQTLPPRVAKALPLMLFPFIIGPMAYAFSGKLIFMTVPGSEGILGQHNRWSVLALSVLFYAAHYALPATYFVFRGIMRVSKQRGELLSVYRAKPDEEFRALVPYELRSLLLILGFVITCFVFHDMAASGILYSPSEGTATQTVSSWMLNTYRRLAANDPANAADMVMKPSIVIFIVCGACAFCAAFGTQAVLGILGQASRVCPFLLRRGRKRAVGYWLLSLTLLIPYIAIGRYVGIPSAEIIQDIWPLTLRSAAVAFCMSGAVWIIAASVRFSSSQRVTYRTWVTVVGLFGLTYAVAPFSLAVASHYWRSAISVNTNGTACLSLGLALCGYYLPIMLAFVAPMTWSITNEETDVLKIYKSTIRECLIHSVWRRYAVDAVVLAVLLFAMCLCEGPITSMYSVWCGSLWELLGSRLGGRGASFHEAATILFLVGVATASFTIVAVQVIDEGMRNTGRER